MKIKPSICMATIMCVICHASSFAQDINSAIDSIIAHNIDLKSINANVNSELLQIKSDNNPANPQVEVEYLWGRQNVGDKLDFTLSQSVDWPGVYTSRKEANNQASLAMAEFVRSSVIDTRLAVKTALIELASANKSISLYNQRIAIMDKLIEKYSAAAAAREITILDIRKLKVEKVRLQEALAMVISQREATIATLVSLNGGRQLAADIETISKYPDDTLLPREEYERIYSEQNPSLRQKSFEASAQTARVKAQRMMGLPGLSIGYRHSREQGEVFNGVSFGISIPAFSNRHKTAAAIAKEQALHYQYRDDVVRQQSELSALHSQAIVGRSQMDQYEAVFKGDNTLTLLQKALDGGQISLLSYLQEMDYFLQVEIDYIQAQNTYQQQLAKLNKFQRVE